MERVMRCKLQLHEAEIVDQPWVTERTIKVKLGAVYKNEAGNPHNGCSENHLFGKYTPMGEFVAAILNPQVIERLLQLKGRQFYVDFTLAPEDADAPGA